MCKSSFNVEAAARASVSMIFTWSTAPHVIWVFSDLWLCQGFYFLSRASLTTAGHGWLDWALLVSQWSSYEKPGLEVPACPWPCSDSSIGGSHEGES